MGFFSWTCAKTHLPILAGDSWGRDPEFGKDGCTVVLVSEKGVETRGFYDGYGHIGSFDLVDSPWYDRIDDGSAVLVLEKWYAGETRGEIPDRSYNEPCQGHFFEPEFLHELFEAGPLPDPASYLRKLKTYEAAALEREADGDAADPDP
ncbi:hypothetical protein LAZ40_01540 [Cereibacter sphaeroides]|uniref:hypothetical protein n=1 Tax=Cereibacter sphaeroides TaxID=1063 RepID=UPI001F3A52B4|nr:hypothetical protein [Cereibacter sphaeroides]MCE6957743.1 hypothetical protein [Cereibacter sphaeroides]MCE6971631.1 hypothetical protein [Cereibacter sphaeroides]